MDKAKSMPRFSLGDRVEINAVIASRHHGMIGLVRELKANRLGRTTLDKYTVAFENGDTASFWDIQLKKRVEPATVAKDETSL